MREMRLKTPGLVSCILYLVPLAGINPPSFRPLGAGFREISDVQSLSGYRQARDDGSQRLARQQQDQAALSAESALSPSVGREREALGEPAPVAPGVAHHRQERHRRGACRDACSRREGLTMAKAA